MQIIDTLAVEVDLQRLLRSLGKQNMRPQIQEDAVWAKKMVEELARPAAVLDLFDLEVEGKTDITLRGEGGQSATLAIGEKGRELLFGARRVQLSFVTLGDSLRQLNEELARKKEILRQYIVDTAAVFALDHLGRIVNEAAEKTAAELGWGVGRRLSPGDLVSWSLEQQGILGNLLPVDEIGLTIGPSGILSPLKSASGLVGMGPGYGGPRVGNVCAWCSHQKTCPIFISKRG